MPDKTDPTQSGGESSAARADVLTADSKDQLPAETEAKLFQEVFAQARKLKEVHVDEEIEWYEKHGGQSRRWFRVVGILTIFLSVSLPALAAMSEENLPHKTLLLSVVSVAVAAFTALGSFFNWDKTWRGNLTTQISLEQARAKWEVEMMRARFVEKPQERIAYVYSITEALLTEVRQVMLSETESFFARVKPPQKNETTAP